MGTYSYQRVSRVKISTAIDHKETISESNQASIESELRTIYFRTLLSSSILYTIVETVKKRRPTGLTVKSSRFRLPTAKNTPQQTFD